jgi:hypothetical protein
VICTQSNSLAEALLTQLMCTWNERTDAKRSGQPQHKANVQVTLTMSLSARVTTTNLQHFGAYNNKHFSSSWICQTLGLLTSDMAQPLVAHPEHQALSCWDLRSTVPVVSLASCHMPLVKAGHLVMKNLVIWRTPPTESLWGRDVWFFCRRGSWHLTPAVNCYEQSLLQVNAPVRFRYNCTLLGLLEWTRLCPLRLLFIPGIYWSSIWFLISWGLWLLTQQRQGWFSHSGLENHWDRWMVTMPCEGEQCQRYGRGEDSRTTSFGSHHATSILSDWVFIPYHW